VSECVLLSEHLQPYTVAPDMRTELHEDNLLGSWTSRGRSQESAAKHSHVLWPGMASGPRGYENGS
jgi:hypothetical protein